MPAAPTSTSGYVVTLTMRRRNVYCYHDSFSLRSTRDLLPQALQGPCHSNGGPLLTAQQSSVRPAQCTPTQTSRRQVPCAARRAVMRALRCRWSPWLQSPSGSWADPAWSAPRRRHRLSPGRSGRLAALTSGPWRLMRLMPATAVAGISGARTAGCHPVVSRPSRRRARQRDRSRETCIWETPRHSPI